MSDIGERSLCAYRPRLLDDLVRVGKEFDGGYLVNLRSVAKSSCLLSFGIGDDWSFESDFLRRNSGVKVFCFDHSVSKKAFRQKIWDAANEILSIRFALLILSLNLTKVRLKLAALKYALQLYFGFSSFFSRKGAAFFEKGVSNESGQKFFTIDQVFQIADAGHTPDSVFVKMDIEQSEYRVLPELLKFEKYICGMVIEFHDLDMLWGSFTEIVTRLQDQFDITHLHGNNFGGVIPGSAIPKVLEVTFCKKGLISEERIKKNVPYPLSGLDQPNDPMLEDYVLTF